MRAISLLAILLLLGFQAVAADWWDEVWSARIRVYIDSSKFTSPIENFPITLRLADAQLPVKACKSDRSDLRAIAGGGTVLPIEIVKATPDRTEINVLIPKIEPSQSVPLFDLYYGNPDAPSSAPQSIWPQQYRAVMHLEGNLNDASSKHATITASGKVDVGKVATFTTEPGYLAIDKAAIAGIENELSIAVRFRMQDGPTLQNLASGLRNDPLDWFNFGLKLPNVVHTNTTSRGKQSHELNPTGIAVDEWHSAVVSYNGVTHTRTICVDGAVLQQDTGLPGPLAIEELRIGRGVLHFEPWQFHGEMDEVRIADAARSNDWLRLEAACLSERNPFIAIGLPQAKDQPAPPPAPFNLLAPADNAPVRTRAATLKWQPSAGADYYRVVVYSNSNAAGVETVLDAGQSTEYTIPFDVIPAGQPVRWSVIAQSQQGAQTAGEKRALNFYDWRETAATPPTNTLEPNLQRAKESHTEINGYLRERIDRIIDRWFLITPESNPAILQVLRDRDKTPLRDPLMPWAGEFAGKFLTGAQYNWRLTHDEKLKAMIDAFVRDLLACQMENGYVGPFPESSRLTGGNWDVWGHYHVMLGLMLYYEDTGDESALAACKKIGDILFETFGPGGPTLTNDGGGGQMNMSVCHGLVLLYKKTGIKRYLELAEYVINDAWNEPNSLQYIKHALAGTPIHQFPQHRWEGLHAMQALAELYWLTGKEEYRTVLEHIWWSCVRGDRHNTGGFTSGEGMAGSPYNQGAIETCCTVAWGALSFDMLRMTGDSRIADELEWSTLNSALGAVPYSGRTCAYNVAMDGTRLFGVELHWQAPRGGPDLNCCSVNAPRPLGMIEEWAVMHSKDTHFINYYGPCTMDVPLAPEKKLHIAQETRYPIDGNVKLVLTLSEPATFNLGLRIPGWSKTTTIAVNGTSVSPVVPGTYHRISREWKSGDTIDIAFDFKPRFWAGDQECANKMSVFRGPLVYAYDGRYNTLNPGELPAIRPSDIKLEDAVYRGEMAPWSLLRLDAGPGRGFFVVDLSSAGQTGNHYRTWLLAADMPPSPFSIDRPVDGVCAQKLSWQAAAGADSYTIDVAQSVTMESARTIEMVTAIEASDLALPPGEWFFSVSAKNKNGETSAANSPIRMVVK
jgi:DUF1680 family protein